MASRWDNFVADYRTRLAEAIGRDEDLRTQLAGFLQALEDLDLDDSLMAHLVITPAGRAWLVAQTGTSECDVLTWAFAAEMAQIFDPGLMSGISSAVLSIPEEELIQAAEMAVSLVKQSITLRDVKFKPARQLAERRWMLVSHKWETGRPTPAEVAQLLCDSRLSGYLETQWERAEKLDDEKYRQWLEAHVKGWLLRAFEMLKGEIKRAELKLLSESSGEERPAAEIDNLVQQRVTLDNIRAKPVSALAQQQWVQMAPSLPAESQPTPVRRELWDQAQQWKNDAELIQKQGLDLLTIQFFDILAVSDFHLAAGNQPSPERIARFSPTEDFYFDDAFFRFLFYSELERNQNRQGYPYELVFNGDMVDFAQIVVPERPAGTKLDFWTLPPLWMRTSSNPAEDDSLPQRLRKIMEEVYPNDQWQQIINRQQELLNAAGRKLAITRLADEYSQKRIDQDEQLAAKWGEWEEGNWESIVQTAWGDGSWSTEEWETADWDYFAAGGKDDQPPERWEDWADAEWMRAAEQLWAARKTEGQRKVRAMDRQEALGQLADAYFGHRRFFQGLAWFLAQGNRLVLTRGNHDPQWYWPEVQLAFIGWLKTAYDELRRICQNPAGRELPVPVKQLNNYYLPDMTLADFEERMVFDYSWYYYRERLLYFEHGGQQEAVDSHRYFMIPVYPPKRQIPEPPTTESPLPPKKATDWLPVLEVAPIEDEIDPPFGSLGNVFFINNMEIEFPNFDRPGYMKQVYLPWLLYQRPRLFFGAFGRALVRLVKALKDWLVRSRKGIAEKHQARVEAYATLTNISAECAQELDTTRWVRNWRNPRFPKAVAQRVALLIPAALALGIYWSLRTPASGQLNIVQTVTGLVTSLILGGVSYWATNGLADYIGLGTDYLLEPSKRVNKVLKKHGYDVPYILFGHDHARNAQLIDQGTWYLNTGSWTPKFEAERKRLVRQPLEYSFVRMLDTHRVLASKPDNYMHPRPEARPQVELLRWDDAAGRVETCETFKGLNEEQPYEES